MKFSICKTFSICAVAALLTAPAISSANANEVTAVGGVDPIILTPVDPMPVLIPVDPMPDPVLLPTTTNGGDSLETTLFSENFDSVSGSSFVDLNNFSQSSAGTVVSSTGTTDYGLGTNMFVNQGQNNEKTTLTLTNLQPNTSIDLSFNMALMNTWDGDLNGDGDRFIVQANDQVLMNESFVTTDVLALRPNNEWSSHMSEYLVGSNDFDIGGNPDFSADVYDFSEYSAFKNIAVTSDTMTFSFYGGGSYNGGGDEYFALDNITVTSSDRVYHPVYGAPAPILGGGLGGLIMLVGGVCAAMRKKIIALPMVQKILSPKLKVAC